MNAAPTPQAVAEQAKHAAQAAQAAHTTPAPPAPTRAELDAKRKAAEAEAARVAKLTPAEREAETKAAEAKAAKAKAKAEREAADAKELEFIQGGAFIMPAELATDTAPQRARSDKQQAMDTKVSELHKLWVKAGKPSTWDKMVAGGAVATYFTEPERSADLHKLITRAVAYTDGVRLRMGTSFLVTEQVREAMAKRGVNLPEAYVGREAVSFAIMDKRPRATSTPAASGSAASN